MPAALYEGWYSSGSSAVRRAVRGGAGGLTAAALALAVIVGEIYTRAGAMRVNYFIPYGFQRNLGPALE